MQLLEGSTTARGLRFAVVVPRFNEFVTDRLREGAIEALTAAGASADSIFVLAVPGSFEIPSAARRAAESGAFDAVVCLGCVIRGETTAFRVHRIGRCPRHHGRRGGDWRADDVRRADDELCRGGYRAGRRGIWEQGLGSRDGGH